VHEASHGGRQILRHIARVAMIERGLQPDFPTAAMRQAAALSVPPRPPLAAAVRDLRGLPWVSIDNDDSRDLDQLTAAEALADGDVRVRVAIADVDALVAPDSPIDAHARHNTTSVYTAARVFPMLPERLSTDITSLEERKDRLAVVAEMTLDSDGHMTGSDLYRAQVCNRAKLAYPSIAAWLEGTAGPPMALQDPTLQHQLHLQASAAQALRALRHAHGSLMLETVQTHAVFGGETLQDLAPDRKTRAAAGNTWRWPPASSVSVSDSR
jgi:VacB/RNase II family 3'-5' exoribonuclease